MKPNFSTLTFYPCGFEVTIIIWGTTAVSIELFPPETGVGEVAIISRCHHPTIGRPRTWDSGWRVLAVANMSSHSLNFRRIGRTRPSPAFACPIPRLSGLDLRLFPSSTKRRDSSIDAGPISKNLDEELVSCIDAERATI